MKAVNISRHEKSDGRLQPGTESIGGAPKVREGERGRGNELMFPQADGDPLRADIRLNRELTFDASGTDVPHGTTFGSARSMTQSFKVCSGHFACVARVHASRGGRAESGVQRSSRPLNPGGAETDTPECLMRFPVMTFLSRMRSAEH